MYIVDDICYAGECVPGIKVVEAKPLKGQMLLVAFNTGEQRLFDASSLTGTVFEPLRDEKIFSEITLFHGIITWKDGEIDIAPETVYHESIPYNQEQTA